MKVFYFQMSEVSGLDFRLFYAGRSTEIPTSEMFYFETIKWNLVVL